MKQFILISGIFFYFISAAITVMATFFLHEDGKPSNAFVPNYNTGDMVWQPDMPAFDLYTATRREAFTNPAGAHNTGPGRDVDPTLHANDLEIQVAYGAYWDALNDNKPISVSAGNAAYTEAVCWHCHSQFVRPMANENYRWGPTSHVGESAHEQPTRFGTRRIGPDLTREGLARSDDWHYAHFDHPKFTVPQSVMAPYGWISRYWNQTPRSTLELLRVQAEDHINSLSNPAAGQVLTGQALFAELVSLMEEFKQQDKDAWVLFKGRENGLVVDSRPIVRVVRKPEDRIRNLVAYVQTRGVGIGITEKTNQYFGKGTTLPQADDPEWIRYIRKLDFGPGIWRIQAPAGRPSSRPAFVMAPAELIELSTTVSEKRIEAARNEYSRSVKRGSNVFMMKCAGCHGGLDRSGAELTFSLDNAESLRRIGNGYGPAADYLVPEPRNFHLGVRPLEVEGRRLSPDERGSNAVAYKNRSGHVDSQLARPEDIFHTIRNGMAPSSMPAWPFLRDTEIWDIVNFIMFLGTAKEKINAVAKDFVAEGIYASMEEAVQELGKTEPSYYNLEAVKTAFAPGPSVPRLLPKPTSNAILSQNFASLSGDRREDYAAAYWLDKLGLPMDGSNWTSQELVMVGRAIYQSQLPDGSSVLRADGGTSPECIQCHGKDGDGWSARRGEMFSSVAFPARNWYAGQFKLGASHDGIFRAMRYGINNTPMNAQITDAWTAIETLGLAEFVLDKRNQGVYGITDMR